MNATRIEKIRFVRDIDENPDTDWIGTFSNEPREGAIDHRERSGRGYDVLQYFNPANPEYAEQEYKHIMRLERGDSCFYGARAEAVIYLSGVRQIITSSGLWGLEHDGGKECEAYFKEEEKNQLEELKEILKDNFKFSASDIDAACANVEAAK